MKRQRQEHAKIEVQAGEDAKVKGVLGIIGDADEATDNSSSSTESTNETADTSEHDQHETSTETAKTMLNLIQQKNQLQMWKNHHNNTRVSLFHHLHAIWLKTKR